MLFILPAAVFFGVCLYSYLATDHTLPGTELDVSLAIVLFPLFTMFWAIMMFVLGRPIFCKALAWLDDGPKGGYLFQFLMLFSRIFFNHLNILYLLRRFTCAPSLYIHLDKQDRAGNA